MDLDDLRLARWVDGWRPSAVGFDLMDTLIRDPWREVVEALIGMTVEGSRPLRDRDAWPDFELDRIDEAGYGRRFFLPGSGHALDVAELRRRFRAGYAFLEGMEPLLAALASRWPVHILSNYPRWYEDVRAQFALDRYVVGHHPSYLVGARKPDRDYYERVLLRAGLAATDLLLVDDRPENVAAARACGMPALLFRDAATLRVELAPLLAGGRGRASADRADGR